MGTRRCIVENCQSCSQREEDKGVSFHKIPQNCETSQIWLAQCRLKALPTNTNNPFVCSRHFRKADFLENKSGKFMLKMRAIPTIFSWGTTPYVGKLPGGAPAPKKKTHMQFALKTKIKKKKPAKKPAPSTEVEVKQEVVKEEPKPAEEPGETPSDAPAVAPPKEKKPKKDKKKQKAPKPTTSTAADTSKIDSELATIEVPVIKTMPINFIPGYRIEAQDFNGAWHSATIMEVDCEEREALIQFDKSTKSKGVADEWIPQDSVRLRSTQPVPLTNKFVEGEKVFARWSDSRKFSATISKVLENDNYTVLFDDGYVKNVRANNISREKRPLSAYEREQLLLQAKASKPSPKKVLTSTKQRPKLPPEIDETTLKEIDKDGEWCCHWVNDIPVGKEGEVQVPSGKILTTIVEDWRLPYGWQKHMYQRGNIAGKWDVILQSPMGRVFRNKSDLRTYLEENGEKYNQDIYDFSIHKRRAKDIGVHSYTEDYLALMQQASNSSATMASPFPVSIVKVEPKLTALLHETIGHGSPQSTVGNVTDGSELMDVSGGELGAMGLDEVYVGALKVKVVENLYCCPKEGCVKTFRKENHLQIHIKHYHEELAKMLGVCPNMTDLAALRTTAEDDMVIEPPPRVPRKPATNTPLSSPMPSALSPSIIGETIGTLGTPTSPSNVLRKKPGPKPKPKDGTVAGLASPSEFGEGTTPGSSPMTVKEEPTTPRVKRKYTHSPDKKNKAAKLREEKMLSSPLLKSFSEGGEVVVKEENLEDPSDGVAKPVPSRPKSTGYSEAFDAFVFDPEAMIVSHSVKKVVGKGEKMVVETTTIEPPVLGGDQPIHAPAEKRKSQHGSTKRGRRAGARFTNKWTSKAKKYPRLSADTSYPDSDETRHSFGVDNQQFYQQAVAGADETGANQEYLIEGGEVIKIVSMRQEEIINCICNYFEEDGLMIQCELCLCWQHGICNGIERESQVPDKYICYICRNPVRGRTSKRYVHDQDWLYEGKLPIGKYHSVNMKQLARFEMLKHSHQLTGNLMELKRFMHSLRVKISIARNKHHPKMYLWAKKWEASPPRDTHHVSGIQPLVDVKLESTANDEACIGKSEQDSLKNSILQGLLSSPEPQSGGDDNLAKNLETLANAALSQQAVDKKKPEMEVAAQPEVQLMPNIPQPEAAINPGECQLKLLEHIQKQQAATMARLEKIESEIEAMESMDDKADLLEPPTSDNFSKTKQTIQMLIKDLGQMKKIVSINSGFL